MATPARSALVVATGSGVEMRSERPKPLHVLCGRPMLRYVLDALAGAGVSRAVVVTGDDPRVRKRIQDDPPALPLQFVSVPDGVDGASAVLSGLVAFDDLDDDEDLIVLPADVPRLRPATIEALLDGHHAEAASFTVLTRPVDRATPGPRLTRDRHGRIDGSLRDPLPAGELTEQPLGCWVVRRSLLAPALRRVAPRSPFDDGALTRIVDVLAASGHRVHAVEAPRPEELTEVVSRGTLAEAEAALRRRTNDFWLHRGVTMLDPERTYIDTTVQLGTDVTLFPGTMLQGETEIGDGCEIGPDTRLDRCRIGAGTVVEKTMARGAVVGRRARVGPFAVLGPGSSIPDGRDTGPFYADPERPSPRRD